MMGQLVVQHYRGLKELYNIVSHGQGIYFATDTKEIILNGESYSGEGKSSVDELKLQVQDNTQQIAVLVGTGEGSVVKLIDDAVNEFANKLTDDNTVNTFRELVDYAAEHSSEIIQLIGEIEAVKTKDEEQDKRIADLEILIGSPQEGGMTIVETVIQNTETIRTLQADMKSLEVDVQQNLSDISELQEKVGDSSVASQIEDALAWEDVE